MSCSTSVKSYFPPALSPTCSSSLLPCCDHHLPPSPSPTSNLSYLTVVLCSSWLASFLSSLPPDHRRRMETEAKAKVVASVWGQIYSMPCCANCFASVNLKEKDEFNLVIGAEGVHESNYLFPSRADPSVGGGGRLNSTQVFSPHEKFKNLNSECKFILWFSWTATIHGLIYNAVVAVRILTLCGLPQYADK